MDADEDDNEDETTEPWEPVLSMQYVRDILNDGIDFTMVHAKSKLLHHLAEAMSVLCVMKQ